MRLLSLVLVGGQELLQLALVVLVKSLQVLDLILVGLLLSGSLFFVLLDDVDDLLVQAGDFVLKLIVGLSKLSDIGLHFIFLLLSHQGFSHAVSDR